MNIQLTYKIEDNKLTLIADNEDRDLLREMVSDGDSNINIEAEAMEYILANSELDHVTPEECGDLTDAPMFGIRDDQGNVLNRWAFMDYALRFFTTDLIETGEAIFTN